MCAEARAEPIHKKQQGAVVVALAKAGLLLIEPRRHHGRETHHVIAKAGIAFVADHRQPFDEQTADDLRIAQRRAAAGFYAVDFSVRAKQRGLQETCAIAVFFQDGG